MQREDGFYQVQVGKKELNVLGRFQPFAIIVSIPAFYDKLTLCKQMDFNAFGLCPLPFLWDVYLFEADCCETGNGQTGQTR